jgi:hypothetical protein
VRHSIWLFAFFLVMGAEAVTAAVRARDEARRWSGLETRRTVAGAGLPVGARVLAVSRVWDAVILGAGAEEGVRPGLLLTALRSDRPVARFRVVETRRSVSAAVLEKRLSRGYAPEAGDRVVVTENED